LGLHLNVEPRFDRKRGRFRSPLSHAVQDVVRTRHRASQRRGRVVAPGKRPDARDGTLAALWDDWHREKEQLELDSTAALPLAWWRETAKRLLPPLDGAQVLDLGCARGGFSRDLAERGARVTAVDISPAAIAFAQPKLDPFGGIARVADASALPFANGAFDVTVALETLHHVSNPDAVLDEMLRVTRPGGQIVISVENLVSVQGLSSIVLRAAGRRVSSAPIWVPMTLPGIWRNVRRRGCRILAVEGGSHLFVVPGIGTKKLPGISRLRSARYFAPNVCIAATTPT
jgi:2-polyprenyl-3-methyl-5-hydroxy-6-metoxy-1,4-benzoquinol methylase